VSREQNIAVGGAPVFSVTADRYDQIMRELPKRLRMFILYNAASSFSEEAVLQYFYRYGEQKTWEKLQSDQNNETAILFGADHPELDKGFTWNKKWSWPRAGIHKPKGRRFNSVRIFQNAVIPYSSYAAHSGSSGNNLPKNMLEPTPTSTRQ